MKDNPYYDGTKLLSIKDINNEEPEIYMCTTNRSAGKTTYFSRLIVNRFLKKKEKFMLVYRFNYELDDCSDKFFKNIGSMFFTDYVMTNKRRANGIYHDLYLNQVHCGYAVALNNADAIKKLSHLFSDTKIMFFDEFQSETNHYCYDEVKKFISVHTSVSRGEGKQYRRVPVIMCGNTVTLLNPYYVAMDISNKLTGQVKFLRGDGFVLEQGFNESASRVQKSGAFNRAFKNESYIPYATENIYMNDNNAFVEQPKGKSTYIATFKYKDRLYGIKEYGEMGIVYCTNKADITFPLKISVTTDDHNINYVMLKQYDYLISTLRFYFERGCFRFKDLMCKEVIMTALSY